MIKIKNIHRNNRYVAPVNNKKIALSVVTSLLILTAPHQQAAAQSINYGLFEDLFGEPVTTSASGKPQRASEVPMNMKILTASDIERSGVTTLPGILKSVAGIDYTSFNHNQEEIAIRGYNQSLNSRLLVLVNGRQVYANFFGHVEWNSIPVELDEIRQIEIVKGPNTSLFGVNAIAGVINIITYSPLYDNKTNARAGLGTDGLYEASGVATAKLSDAAGIRMSSGYTEMAPFSRETNPQLVNIYDKSHTYRGSIEGMFQLNDKTQLDVEATGSEAILNYNPLFANPYVAELESRSAKARLETETPYGTVKLTAYKNWLDYKNADPQNDNTAISDTLNHFQAEILGKVDEKNTLRFSAEYRNSKYDGKIFILTPNEGNSLSQKTFSLSGLWDSQISEKLSTSISVRWDHHSMSRAGFIPPTVTITNKDFNEKHSVISYNLGVVYKVAENSSFRITAAKGVQEASSVSLSGFFYEPVFGGLTISGNPDLESTTLMNYEFGYDQIIPVINGEFRTSFFHQKTNNINSSSPTMLTLLPSFVPGSQNVTLGNSKATGFEFELSGETSEKLRWGLNYSYIDIEDDMINFIGGQLWYDREAQNQSPKHHFNISFGYDFNKFELDVLGHYISKKIGIIYQNSGQPYLQVPVDDNFLMEGRITYNLTDSIKIDLKGSNLFNKQTNLSGVGITERRLFTQLRMSF